MRHYACSQALPVPAQKAERTIKHQLHKHRYASQVRKAAPCVIPALRSLWYKKDADFDATGHH